LLLQAAININIVRFQVLTAASMKIAVFWDVAPCSLVEVYRRLIALMMEAATSISETSVNFYQSTRRNIIQSSSREHLFVQNSVSLE
jgi:hypothetical protein